MSFSFLVGRMAAVLLVGVLVAFKPLAGQPVAHHAASGVAPATVEELPPPVEELPPPVEELPPPVAEAVRAQVAHRWGVDPALVVLDFGAVPRDWTPADDAPVTLAGSGAGGHWVARIGAGDHVTGVRVRAGVETQVLVAARTLERGVAVSASDMAYATEVRWGEPEAGDHPVVEGWTTQRVVREGEPLRAPAVQPPMVVQSGQPVEVLWRRGRVGVRVPGKAAGSGPLGAEVYVRTDSGRRLRGVVVAPGVVDVTLKGSGR